MRKILCPTLLILVISMIISVIPTDAEGAIYEDTVRLHILASSDSKEDQELKLKVRDAVLEEYGKELSGLNSSDEAADRLLELLPSILKTAERVIRECGYSYSVRASIGKEHYGRRVYDSFTLPEGTYTSLKIEIGEARGQNWWCVMYPPLCLGASVDGVGYTGEEKRLIKGDFKIKFKVLELISCSFG